MSEPLLLRVGEAAERLGISRSRCYQLINAGIIPVIDLAGTRRIPLAGLEGLIAAGTVGRITEEFDESGDIRIVRR